MMLKHLIVAESICGTRSIDPHRYASFMCGMHTFWRRVANWFH